MHETVEKVLIDELKLHYLHAHLIASQAEEAAVRAVLVSWLSFVCFLLWLVFLVDCVCLLLSLFVFVLFFFRVVLVVGRLVWLFLVVCVFFCLFVFCLFLLCFFLLFVCFGRRRTKR